MKIKTILQEEYKELYVCKDRSDDEVRRMIVTLHDLFDSKIPAVDAKGNHIALMPGEIVSLYAQDQKVYAMGNESRYTVSGTLYELEKELEPAGFIRISKSEIVNIEKIQSVDMSMTGTIRLIMKNGYETYTSRRNVAKIKELLVRRSRI